MYLIQEDFSQVFINTSHANHTGAPCKDLEDMPHDNFKDRDDL